MSKIYSTWRDTMKINFDYMEKNQNVDNNTTTYRAPMAQKTERAGSYAIDISGNVMDNNAYGGQGKTAEEVMQNAGNTDVALMRDYMTVMSNSMSEEDFAKMQEEGYSVHDTEIETVVTVVDKIKATLAQAGVHIQGYTDDISKEKLEEITGNTGRATQLAAKFTENGVPVTEDNITQGVSELDKAEALQPLTDSMYKYMVQNHMEPTIDNVYKAQHSTANNNGKQAHGYYAQEAGGYYAKKAENVDFEKIKPQIEAVIEKAGEVVSKQTLDDAKWLIEQGIPCTEETFSLLEEVKSVQLPLTQEAVMKAITNAIADGKEPKDALLTEKNSLLAQAVILEKEIHEISDENIHAVAAKHDVVTIHLLLAAQNDVNSKEKNNTETDTNTENTNDTDKKQTAYDNPAFISAKRKLEEIRLQMTVEANYALLKSGYAIDTAPLEELVEALKQAEEKQNSILFGNDADLLEKVNLYKESITVLNEIPALPADILGKAALKEIPFTLQALHEEGNISKAAYENANESYEALMTAPRKDLGDSIKTAFRNVDAILEDMQLVPTENNRKAVRILGYNNTEITIENINTVKDASQVVEHVIENMTPAKTLQMIRDNINPLTTSMEDIENYLELQAADEISQEDDYAKFLWKLEKNQNITQSERDSYVGIYRLVRQIEKSDGAVIGNLVASGAEVNFKNLLSAVRTNKSKKIDVSVNESFGGLEKVIEKGVSISKQIESAFIEPKQNEQLEKEFIKQQIDSVREVKSVEDSVIKELLEFDQPVTIDNLLAADYLKNAKGSAYSKLFETAKETGKKNEKKLKDAVSTLQESFTDEESTMSAYEELYETASEIMEESAYEENNAYVDVREKVLLHKQISLAVKYAREENYEVPIMIHDELTSLNVKIVRGSGEKGKVSATMETDTLGKIAAEFSISQNEIFGFIVSNKESTAEILSQNENTFSQNISKEKQVQIHMIMDRDLDLQAFDTQRMIKQDKLTLLSQKETEQTISTEETISTKELYETAKTFIISIQGMV